MLNIQKLLFIIVLCYFQLSLKAQSTDTKRIDLNPWEDVNGFRLATNFLSDYEFEASYLITSYPKTEPGLGAMAQRVQYIGLGLEYLNVDNKSVLGLKASYEESFFLFSGQLGFDYLTDFGANQFRFTPKIGASLFGFITLYYGWNINLNQTSTIQTRSNNITLQLNLLE